jgi:hypothetical protein
MMNSPSKSSRELWSFYRQDIERHATKRLDLVLTGISGNVLAVKYTCCISINACLRQVTKL